MIAQALARWSGTWAALKARWKPRPRCLDQPSLPAEVIKELGLGHADWVAIQGGHFAGDATRRQR